MRSCGFTATGGVGVGVGVGHGRRGAGVYVWGGLRVLYLSLVQYTMLGRSWPLGTCTTTVLRNIADTTSMAVDEIRLTPSAGLRELEFLSFSPSQRAEQANGEEN